MKTRTRRSWALVLGILAAVAASAQSPAGDEWAGTYQECVRMGLEEGAVERIMLQCREREMTALQARRLLEPAGKAAQEGLPAEPVMARVREGLAKSAPPDVIAEAAQNRVRRLERARVMMPYRRSSSDDAEGELLISVALALESGVPEGVLEDVLRKSARRRASEVRTVVEAGEALALNGFPPEDMRDVMNGCLQRNLRRTEILRTVRYAIQRHGEGVESGAMRKALWGSEAVGSRGGAGGGVGKGRGAMQRAGAAAAFGSPAGAPAGDAASGPAPAVNPANEPGASPGPGGKTPGGDGAPGPGGPKP